MSASVVEHASQILKEVYGIVAELRPLASEWGGTYEVSAEHKYLLKIAPDHVPPERVELEKEMLRFLRDHAQVTWVPRLVQPQPGSPEDPRVRLYAWVHGIPLRDVSPHAPELLAQIGRALGEMRRHLQHFEHPAADFPFEWAPHNWEWINEEHQQFEGRHRALVSWGIQELKDVGKGVWETLPMGVNYGDANDDNIIVRCRDNTPEFSGFIDFGDIHAGPRINDLAICLTYVMMGKSAPVDAGCEVIRGYCKEMELTEWEVQVLLPLVIARLLISVTKAQQRAKLDPDNAYWQISVRDAWKLLATLKEHSQHLVLCHFRHAAGFEPSPRAAEVRAWLNAEFDALHPILGFDLRNEQVTVFDWSVASSDLGDFNDMADVPASTVRVFAKMKCDGTRVGVGRYNEPRPVYTTSEYAVPANDGTRMRTVHIGLDLFMPAGTALYAPLDGVVETIVDNKRDKEYGPLLILRHDADADRELVFYTLYGHNSLATLGMWNQGDQVTKGQKIAEIGPYPENGNWVPHVHFQIVTDLLDLKDDFPGVAAPEHRAVWLSLCPDPNLMLGIGHKDLKCQLTETAHLLRRRRQILGRNLSVSYATPLQIVRGWHTKLYDEEGRGYLDTRNNIAHVGHEHPRLTQVARAQIALLNTNTRYLHAARISCAEALLATLPSHLRYVYFVNSGSEANDLALRMARAYTGQKMVVTLDQAYHGHTQSVLDVSPYKFNGPGGSGCPEHTVVLPAPDTYRANGDSVTEQALDILTRASIRETPLVFIHESLPGCAGQLVPPTGYFRQIYEEVHQRGGVCIADEVQTGLARVGQAMWSFELYDIIPDIVTIGKPLGNGHPVAAVVASEAIALAFDNGMEYFNSFGGNPVSCKIALEVMRIVEEERLQEHALQLGSVWVTQLRALQSSYPVIGDVRGHGLFIGVEFSRPGTRQPATKKAAYVVRRMLDHRILTSIDGPDHNVLKIKPPMSITHEDVDFFMETLEKILGETVMQRQ